MSKKWIIIALSLLLPLSAGVMAEEKAQEDVLKQIDDQIAKAGIDSSKSNWRTSLPEPTVVDFPAGKSYVATMTTNKGPIEIRLMPEVAPMHVTSFIYLTRLGFYDGLTFHRVIPGFMAQGGCPLGTGSGDPGYEYDSEIKPDVRHDKGGLLSQANTGRPGTDGSQFFLTFVPTPWLDGKHTIYGEVTSGMETLKALEALGSSPSGRTREPLNIEKVTIEVK
jgi:cyclophilin family peptidyl-prolyl cis-trans isomerase